MSGENKLNTRDGIVEIGLVGKRVRGPSCARARRAFDALFAGELGELELGGLLVALRMNGASPEVLRAAMDALDPRLRRVDVDPARPVVAIPSYGRARTAPNLVPLLACLLAGYGLQVVVHGVERGERRASVWDVWQAMGLGPTGGGACAEAAIARGIPALVPVAELSPALAHLLSLRARLGVRSIGHTLVNLLNPTRSHACVGIALTAGRGLATPVHLHLQRAERAALVMRGIEGDAVAGTRGSPRIDWVHDGRIEVAVPAVPHVPADAAVLPDASDAPATARWIQSVLAGEQPVPPAIGRQVDAVLGAVAATAPGRRIELA